MGAPIFQCGQAKVIHSYMPVLIVTMQFQDHSKFFIIRGIPEDDMCIAYTPFHVGVDMWAEAPLTFKFHFIT